MDVRGKTTEEIVALSMQFADACFEEGLEISRIQLGDLGATPEEIEREIEIARRQYAVDRVKNAKEFRGWLQRGGEGLH
jgi:hypothetical protein